MSESYYWTAVDAKAGRCTHSVIGTERRDDPADDLGPAWSPGDARAGRCLASEVGRPRNPPAELLPDQIPAPEPEPETPADDTEDAQPEPTDAAEPFQPMTRAERRRMLQELSDKLLRKAHGDLDGFMADGSSQLNKLIDLANKTDSEDTSHKDLATLTAKHLARLPDSELDAGLLRTLAEASAAVQRALQAAGADPAAVDVVGIFRDSVGLTPEIIQDMLADMK